MNTKQVLKECSVFSALSDSELDRIASLAVEKQYEAGTTIFEEGDSAQEFFVLQEGKVALQMTFSERQGQLGRRITVDVVNKNEIVGWSAIVEPYTYTLTAVCLQKVNALSIDGSKFRRLLRDNHHIGYEVLKETIKVVASRLDDTRQVLISERLLPVKL
ncbi:MAG: cyclic nucleotide-binding domain-containing protein [Chloroflexi bacterium]|nr:cyclic nucleotide-binding domain-containing protein [Chloroflexota bacterium]MBI2979622.1 cyclic nucleotide-binding domain-containing protein [Chloroflexota bacterium]